MGRRTTRSTGFLASLAWILAFGLAGAGLVWLGRYRFLSIDWSDPLGWLAATDPETAVAALARAVGLGLVAWVAATTVIYVGARLLGAAPTSINWLSIRPLRKAIDAALAGSLVVSTFAPVTAAAAPIVGPELTAPVATGTAVPSTPETTGAVAPGYVPIPAGTSPPAVQELPEGEEPDSAAAPETGRAEATAVIVTPGDNLWKLAEERLEAMLGRPPSDADTAPYWAQLIEANRDRIQSGDPDLIYPGEEIVLPAINLES